MKSRRKKWRSWAGAQSQRRGAAAEGSRSRFRAMSTATTSLNSEEHEVQFLYLSKALHKEVQQSSLMKNGLEGNLKRRRKIAKR